ncbi:MAG: hypothetical protein LBS73_06040, partial [Campylobacteraceae bacterium]|nr:hypothetical protein [Campylobacteraceae bacterium]
MMGDALFEKLRKWATDNGIDNLSYDMRYRCERGIPRDKLKLLSLKTINLSRLNLTMIPKELCYLNLISLKLKDNQIEQIPHEIANLTSLQELDFSYNALDELPRELFDLPNLISLSLCSNKLHYIPNELENLTKLEVLDLDCNQFRNLPHEISKLTL